MLVPSAAPPISKREAERDVASRELARRRLLPFIEYVAPWYNTQRHHTLVAHKLEAVEKYVRTKGREGINRLIIEEPPRYGKTEEVAKLFPSWVLGRNPDLDVIITSYSDNRASEASRAVRDYIRDPRYQNVFGERAMVEHPVQITQDSRAALAWDLAYPHRGGLRAAGVGGGLTGSGAHLLIADDLYRGRKEAESESYRKQVQDFWSSVLYTRLEDHAAIVIIMTRWHPDDIVGHLLKEMVFTEDADQWEVVCLPAVAFDEKDYAKDEEEQLRYLKEGLWVNQHDPLGRKPGEALWPKKYSLDQLKKIKANVSPYDWEALYQQMPRPRRGGFFTEEWDLVDPQDVPTGLQWFRYWDLAASPRKDADSTASGAVAMDFEGTVWLRDGVKWNTSWPETKEKIKDFSKVAPGDELWGIENVAMQLIAVQELLAEPELANRFIMPVTPEGSKEARAYPLQARQALRKVKIVKGPWVHDFLQEAARFPKGGAHDDQIDWATGGMQMIRDYAEFESDEQVFIFEERVSISSY